MLKPFIQDIVSFQSFQESCHELRVHRYTRPGPGTVHSLEEILHVVIGQKTDKQSAASQAFYYLLFSLFPCQPLSGTIVVSTPGKDRAEHTLLTKRRRLPVV